MLERIRRHAVMAWLAAIIGLLGAAAVVKLFFTDTAPWLISLAGGAGALIIAGIATATAVYFAYQYLRYRAATRKLMWRYIIDVQDAQAKQEGVAGLGLGLGQSEAVKRGEESADRAWGDRYYRELLHLPPEDEYR